MNEIKHYSAEEIKADLEIDNDETFVKSCTCNQALADKDKRIEQLEKALRELRKNSMHNHTCDIMSMDAECSCGFNKAVELYNEALKEKG